MRYPVTGKLEAFGVGFREIVGLDGELIYVPAGVDAYG